MCARNPQSRTAEPSRLRGQLTVELKVKARWTPLLAGFIRIPERSTGGGLGHEAEGRLPGWIWRGAIANVGATATAPANAAVRIAETEDLIIMPTHRAALHLMSDGGERLYIQFLNIQAQLIPFRHAILTFG
jgi:hypothetical protein